jgi:hypothetical protein
MHSSKIFIFVDGRNVLCEKVLDYPIHAVLVAYFREQSHEVIGTT